MSDTLRRLNLPPAAGVMKCILSQSTLLRSFTGRAQPQTGACVGHAWPHKTLGPLGISPWLRLRAPLRLYSPCRMGSLGSYAVLTPPTHSYYNPGCFCTPTMLKCRYAITV